MSHCTYSLLNHSEERHVMELGKLLIVYFLHSSVSVALLCIRAL